MVETFLTSVHNTRVRAEHAVDHNHEISTFQHGLEFIVFLLVTLAWYTIDRDETYTRISECIYKTYTASSAGIWEPCIVFIIVVVFMAT